MGEGVRRREEEKEEGGCINFRLFLEPVRTTCSGSVPVMVLETHGHCF